MNSELTIYELCSEFRCFGNSCRCGDLARARTRSLASDVGSVR